MAVVEIGQFSGKADKSLQHRSGLPTWYRARYLTGLVARSQLMIIDLELGDRGRLAHHLARIAGLSLEAGLDGMAAEAERLRELMPLTNEADYTRAIRRLHIGILALRDSARQRSA